MSLINKRYANYYNTRYRLTGHVFEKRFYDDLIDEKEGMLEVSRYIHLNPVEARMVKKPESYPSSSFRIFKNATSAQLKFMDVKHILDFYTGILDEKRKKYCKSVWVTSL
ncbi:transposase, partial [Schinkia azotoformans]|uniref:transposase n=1 Tax=Schinkia azotoformans TaxID=1454 RepID=UPI002E9D6E9D|nr:transposase [Schinkia azotoformans]